jgi:hypothetical protein
MKCFGTFQAPLTEYVYLNIDEYFDKLRNSYVKICWTVYRLIHIVSRLCALMRGSDFCEKIHVA